MSMIIISSIEKMTKQQIMDAFVELCKVGTSHDCSVFVSEARRKGITYEELCEYKRKVVGEA